jgi:hypothetical protein
MDVDDRAFGILSILTFQRGVLTHVFLVGCGKVLIPVSYVLPQPTDKMEEHSGKEFIKF